MRSLSKKNWFWQRNMKQKLLRIVLRIVFHAVRTDKDPVKPWSNIILEALLRIGVLTIAVKLG